ncbi:rab1 small GTP-binding protein [Trypanosoma cruzi]|nr:rab1 small GTP-binding protein [Trypanosoma cruzi]
MQRTSTQRKAHESYDRPRRTSSGLLECIGASHKTGCVAARGSNRGDIQFGPTRDLAVGEALRPVRPSPEHSAIFGEVHNTADPGVVTGRIFVNGRAAEVQKPWLRAAERFFMIFIIMLLQ